MPVMLADSIDGGIFTALILFGGWGASLLALAALIPAVFGKKKVTISLIIPAFAYGVCATLWLAYGSITTKSTPETPSFFPLWFLFTAPAFATSMLTAFILWFRVHTGGESKD